MHLWEVYFLVPTILTYMIMLENCQNNILVFGCSPIQGTKFYYCWNLMKTGSHSGTYILSVAMFYLTLFALFLWKILFGAWPHKYTVMKKHDWDSVPGMQCEVCSGKPAVSSMQCTACIGQCAVCSLKCAMCSVQCAVSSV